MAYATLAQVKRWLLIPESDTRDDAEIGELLDLVHAEVEAMVMKYADALPSQDQVLANYEAMWAAGLFRMRREKTEGVHDYVKFAVERIEQYLSAKHRRGVRKG